MIYFDNSATTVVLPSAAQAAARYMTEVFYNPSAAYSPAVAAEHDVNAARGRIASHINASASELIFTSGGTESNNTAIFGSLAAKKGKGRVVTSAVEHPSVTEPMNELAERGYEVITVGVDEFGAVRTDELAAAITSDTVLISIMHVNNEVGAVNDIASIYKAMRKAAPDALLHVDGVQAFMKEPPVPCDMYSISGHKLHAPKGVGALYIKSGVRIRPYSIGGGQENGLRSGTTNTPAIMGLDAAVLDYAANAEAYHRSMYAVKERLLNNLLRIRDVRLNGPSLETGAPHILNMSFLGVRGEVLLNALSERGLYVSTGSACSAHKKGRNRVLTAMGILGERQEGALRFSFCPLNTVSQADTAAQLIEEQLTVLRRFRRR